MIPTILGTVIEQVRTMLHPLTFFDPISSFATRAIENLWENAPNAKKCL